jgi:uncharacterized protein (DUF1800 family)
MGDENSVLTDAEARHFLRRAGFGALPRDVDRILQSNETRGQTADRLLALKPQSVRPSGRDFETAHGKWIKFLIKTKTPVYSKLALFWHDHFSTSFAKVQNIGLMADQIQLLHRLGGGDMRVLVKAINKNAAMMKFLDTVTNRKAQPNENYARELQELFTLGVLDFAGNANYTQEDIVQIARAFTGWGYDDHGNAFFTSGRHDFTSDFPERGPKVIYQTTGGFGPGGRDFTVNGEGEAEIDTVIDIIFEHRDTDGKKTVARRTASRLLEFYTHAAPSNAVADAVVVASQFDVNWNVAQLLRAIFVHDAFYETMAPAPYGPTTPKSVKWPVDFVVSTLRLLGMRLKGREQELEGGPYLGILTHLDNMGQVLLQPPSVFGWDWETAWISSATLLARYGFARDVTAARGGGSTAFRPERLIDLSLTDPGAIVDAVLGVLGLRNADATSQLTAAERQVLIDYLTDGGLNPTLDLGLYDTRNTKLNGLFALVLESPGYQLH